MINSIISIFSNMSKTELFFGTVSVIGTLLAIFQTYKLKSQERELQQYKYLFDIADKSIDKEKTIEELNVLAEEKKRMDEAIKKELPLQAHLTVLSDRLKDDEKNLVVYYERYHKTKREYEILTETTHTEIPEGILKEIENQIMPDYLIKEKKDNAMRETTLLSFLSAVFFGFPLTAFLGRVTFIVLFFSIIRLFYISLPQNKKEREEFLFNSVCIFFQGVTIVASLGFIILTATGEMFEYRYESISIMISLAFLLLIPLDAFMYFYNHLRKRRKLKDKLPHDNKDEQEEKVDLKDK